MSILHNSMITSLEINQTKFYFLNLLMLDFNDRLKATLSKQIYGDYDINARITGVNIFENNKLVGFEYVLNHERIGSSETFIPNLVGLVNENITALILLTIRQKVKVSTEKISDCKYRIILRLPETLQFDKNQIKNDSFSLETGLKDI